MSHAQEIDLHSLRGAAGAGCAFDHDRVKKNGSLCGHTLVALVAFVIAEFCTVFVFITATPVGVAPVSTDWVIFGTDRVISTAWLALLTVAPFALAMYIICRIDVAGDIEARTVPVVVLTAYILDALIPISISVCIRGITDRALLTVDVSIAAASVRRVSLSVPTDWMGVGAVVVVYAAFLTTVDVTPEAVFMVRHFTHSIVARTFTVGVIAGVVDRNAPFAVAAISWGAVHVFQTLGGAFVVDACLPVETVVTGNWVISTVSFIVLRPHTGRALRPEVEPLIK